MIARPTSAPYLRKVLRRLQLASKHRLLKIVLLFTYNLNCVGFQTLCLNICVRIYTCLDNGSRMSATYQPPELGPESCYDAWRREVEMWRRVTELTLKNQALAVTLSLKGKYREIATEIDVEILNQDNGMTELFKVLDANFKKETVDSSFSAYLDFEHFGRAHLSVPDYILEFERRYNKIKRLNMTLPDEILGCKLLDFSGLDQKEKQMVLTSVKSLKFEDIKTSMKRIFSSLSDVGTVRANDDVVIKTEAFVSRNKPYFQQRPQRYNERPKKQGETSGGQQTLNPKNKFGKTSRCAHCGSIFHWVKDCKELQMS